MAKKLYMSIPVEYVNKTLTIKSLALSAKGESPDEALFTCIKSTSLYVPLMLAKFKQEVDFRGRFFLYIEVPFESSILNKIYEVSPLPEDKKPTKRHLQLPSPEETIKWGY